MAIHRRICNLCEATCGILVETEERRIISIRGDESDPFSRGYVCPKAVALRDTWEDPNRLRVPLLRDGGGWRECSWDEAIETAARGIHEVQRRHGKDAVAVYSGNPSVHNLPALLANPPFIRMLGTKVRFSASSADQFPRMLAAYFVYGGQFSIPVADVDHTDYFLILGANPIVSNGSLMTAPGMRRRLRAIKDRGGKVVVVDPRRSETAAVASEHVFLRPGTDALFLMAMIEALFAAGLVDSSAADCASGVEELRTAAGEFPAERVAPVTGVEAETVRRLAREFASAPTAACYARIGTCVQSYGTLVNALVDAVNVLTGRLDRRGGVMFTTPASGGVSPGHYGRWHSRVRGIPEFGGEIPVATMSEEMTTPGAGQVRALVTMAGNPVLSTPNGRRLDEALAGLDFMVSVDPALNETTRHARVILPPRHSLENDQFALVFQRLSVRNTVKFCPPVFAPEADEWSEWEILGRLAASLALLREADPEAGLPAGGTEPFAASPRDLIDGLLAMGPHDVSIASLLDQPAGVDLGPLEEGRLSSYVHHEDGRLHLMCPELAAEIERLRTDFGAGRILPEQGRLLLIGRRQLRSNNSWMHHCPTLMKGPDRCTLLIHPDDAARLGVDDGKTVRVRSRVGEVVVRTEITDEVMAGVVSLPHGFGHDRPGTRLGVAGERPGVSMNDLTDESVVEGLLGNAVLTAVPVELQPVS